MARTALALILAAIFTSAASNADAHVSLDAPRSRYYDSGTMAADQIKQKDAPCGAKGDSRTTNTALVSTFKPGERISVSWKETVQHPGHFRIAFDTDGQDFSFPGVTPLASGVTVLADDIADLPSNGGTYTQEVTLPNIECSNCTLQLVQVMVNGSGPYKAADLYFNCADLVLKSDGGAGGTGGASNGGASPMGGSGGKATSGTGGAPAAAGGAIASGGASLGGASGGAPSASGGTGTNPGSGGSVAAGGGASANGGWLFGASGSTSGASTLGSGGAVGSGGATAPAGGAISPAGGAPAFTPRPDPGGCAMGGGAGPLGYGALGLATFLTAMALRRRRSRSCSRH